jgi:hypothetical protein
VSRPLKLRAEDVEDLVVLSTCLQDALVHVGEMAYLPRRRRFVLACNRFKWEAATNEGQPQRVRCGIHFDGVMAVRNRGFDPGRPDQLLELLALRGEPGEDGAATIAIEFAGGAAVRLEVECIDGNLADLGAPWEALARPGHGLADDEETLASGADE